LFKLAIQFFSSISFQIGPELIGAFSTKKKKTSYISSPRYISNNQPGCIEANIVPVPNAMICFLTEKPFNHPNKVTP
jgi:hypothetical protein